MRILLVTDRFSVGVLDLAAFYTKHGCTVDCVLTSQLHSVNREYSVVGFSLFGFVGSTDSVVIKLSKIAKSLKHKFSNSKIWLGGRALSLLSAADITKIKTLADCDIVCTTDGESIMTSTVDFKTYPAWICRHIEQLRGKDRRAGVVCVQSARGCVYSCNFCHKAQPLHYFAPERTALNIKFTNDIVQFPDILDDIFTLNPEHMRNIRLELDRLKVAYKRKMLFFTHVKHRTENEMLLFDPKEVQIGIESGDDRILTLMNKKTTRAENKEAVVRLGKILPGRLTGLFLIGYPGENEASLKNTLSFIQETRQYYRKVWVSYYVPIPNTVGMTQALANGSFIDHERPGREIAYIDRQLTEDCLRTYREAMMKSV